MKGSKSGEGDKKPKPHSFFKRIFKIENEEKRQKLKNSAGRLCDFLFPINAVCNDCGRENFSGKPFCEECEKYLPLLSGAVCNHCGRKTVYQTERCDSCSGRETHFDAARAVYDYDEPIKQLIWSLKYENKRYIAKIFARDLCNVYLKNFFNCDFALYVPMTEEREKERGYNQAKLLAEKFSCFSGIEVKNDIIYKRRETKRQATLSFEERKKNLEGSFGVKNRKRLLNKRVLLIDDVMTTGATVESICKLLKKHGADFVAVITVASVQKPKNY